MKDSDRKYAKEEGRHEKKVQVLIEHDKIYKKVFFAQNPNVSNPKRPICQIPIYKKLRQHSLSSSSGTSSSSPSKNNSSPVEFVRRTTLMPPLENERQVIMSTGELKVIRSLKDRELIRPPSLSVVAEVGEHRVKANKKSGHERTTALKSKVIVVPVPKKKYKARYKFCSDRNHELSDDENENEGE